MSQTANLSYVDLVARGELSEQAIDQLYAEHARLGHSDDDHAGECYGCLYLENLADLNARNAK